MQDADEDEIETSVDISCRMRVDVELKVPMATRPSRRKGGKLSPSLRPVERSIPSVNSITVENFTREEFKFDVTWITENLHNLDSLWHAQSQMVHNAIAGLIRRSFESSAQRLKTDDWIRRKFMVFEEQLPARETRDFLREYE